MRRALRARHTMLSSIRSFFAARDFLEVQTPVRIPTPALEDYIDAEPSGDAFLRTSPELHMKRMLAAGYQRIFQLGPCFRKGEEGRLHLPEFSMLEWYRLDADHHGVLTDTSALLPRIACDVTGDVECRFRGQTVSLAPPWESLTVSEAFRLHAGCNVDTAVANGEFERLLVDAVEPKLGLGSPTVLTEYPTACGGLARTSPQAPDRLERWELYLCGVELANACSELVDVEEQIRRFEQSAGVRRRDGRDVYPMDEGFLAALRSGLPPCAGVAIGVDRLLMVLTDADSIADVVPFVVGD